MAEYMNKETFLASMGLIGDETKYGNRDGEHQHRSYSTYMSYEIMDCVEDSIEADVAPVVHGRWIGWFEKMRSNMTIGSKDYECSICNGESERPYDYCPNCGAKMDAEE